MRIPDLFQRGEPVFSFEFFLPKAPEDMAGFSAGLDAFRELAPSFITLTYGAGGSQRDRTIDAAGMLKKRTGLETACHLTCITHTKAEVAAILDRLAGMRIENIVALRGDLPKEGTVLPAGERDFGYARDLVEFIRADGRFSLAVAGYPESHPESPSPEEDLRRLAEKMRAGGDWVITQLFFDNRDYFDFVRRARAAGVSAPIVPGIMPVTGFSQLKRFTALCGAKLPAAMTADLERLQADPAAVLRYGVDYATRQCRELLEAGAPGVHFYTLNRSHSTTEILKNLRQTRAC